MENQRTIAREFRLEGVGLHTADKVHITFKPAPENTGIVFVRTDLAGKPAVKASLERLLPQSRGPRRTSLGDGAAEVCTIEHLMAALSGLGIDNLCIELDSVEVPGLDGSSLNFVEALKAAGITEQAKERQRYGIKEPLFVEEDGASLMALPSNDFKISYTLSYNHPLLKAQFMEVNLTGSSFEADIASARTFCLEEEADSLKQQGVGQGANYTNTLVLGKQGVINNTLRYEDEFIRHKILDLIGDLYLLGQPLRGHIIAIKSGHSLNLKLAQKIRQQQLRYGLGGIGIQYHPQEETELDITKIMDILPHREPFLFVDRVISLEKGKHAVGIKNVTINDYFFKGHFPGKPVMPGVIMIEAMAQVGGIMMLSPQENRGKLAYFLAADNIKFRKTVVPGDQLVLDVKAGRIKSRTGQVHGQALVDGKVVAEADLMFALVED